MKSRTTGTTMVFAILLSTGLVLSVVSCSAFCPNCSPVVNCVASIPAPTATSSAPVVQNGMVGSAAVSSRACTLGCTNPPPSGFLCMEHSGACDSSVNKCKLKLIGTNQCGEGSLRNCTTTTGGRGVTRCNTTTCEFPGIQAGCAACGAATQPCCVGGCDSGHTCLPDPTNLSSQTYACS